jgi:hypothetical protein
MTYTNWNCNQTISIDNDLSGQARPYAVMSTGKAFSVPWCNAPPSPVGLWSNSGFSATLSIAYGKFMGGGSQAACDESVFPADTYYGERNINGWYSSACAARDTSVTYICKVLV